MENRSPDLATEVHSYDWLGCVLKKVVSSYDKQTTSASYQSRPRRRRASPLSFTGLRSILLASICVMLWCSPCLATAITFGSVALGKSEILFDHRPPPPPAVRLIKRAQESSVSTTTGISIASSTTETSALPSPFDSSIGNNFTASSCPAFFQSFLSSSAFNDCLPLSLLLQVRPVFSSCALNFPY